MDAARSVAELFFAQAGRLGARPFLHWRTASGWRHLSYADAAAQVTAGARALIAAGLAPGARVALLSENRPEWLLADLACLAAGLVDVPIYPTSPAAEVEPLLRRSGVEALLLSSREQWAKVRVLLAGLPRIRLVVTFDAISDPLVDPSVKHGAGDRCGVPIVALPISWARFLAGAAGTGDAGPAGKGNGKSNGNANGPNGHGRDCAVTLHADLAQRLAGVDRATLATILFTSGTTGEPKGVMLTHGNLLANCEAILEHIEVGPGDRTLSFLPLSHSFERTAGHYTLLMAGGEIAYATSPERVATEVREIRPTLLLGVPRFFEKVQARILGTLERAPRYRRALFDFALHVADAVGEARRAGGPLPLKLRFRNELADRLVFSLFRRRMGGRLRFFVSGGAPLDPELVRFFGRLGLPVLEGYGLTETAPVVACNRPGRAKPGSVGEVLPGVTARLAADGEILVRGPNVMQGYLDDAAATAAALDPDGSFRTGDIGHLDADGYLFVTDRKKDLIIGSGGKNVAPARVEGLLKRHRIVADCCLVGDRRPYLVALLVPDEAALKNWVQEQGGRFMNRAGMFADPTLRDLFQNAVDATNAELAPPERVRRFVLLADPFSQENGELTPTLKVRRRVVEERYRGVIDALYAEPPLAVAGSPIPAP